MKLLPAARRSPALKPLLVFAVLSATAAVLAACGGAGGGYEATAGSREGAQTGGGAVSVKSIGNAGPVLVDSSGQALYASNREGNGMILCTEACTSFWEPLAASGGTPTASSSLSGKLGVIQRPDGTRQVTYAGKPLYSFTQEEAGEVTGDGFVDNFNGNEFSWSVVTVEGAAESSGGGGETASSGAASESSGSTRSYGY
jgi:predicted lipoprotein with Yx(FWY)xxD motif